MGATWRIKSYRVEGGGLKGDAEQNLRALQNATATRAETCNFHDGHAPILRFSVPSGWHAPCSLPARGEAAAEESMNRKHKQFVSIWTCLAARPATAPARRSACPAEKRARAARRSDCGADARSRGRRPDRSVPPYRAPGSRRDGLHLQGHRLGVGCGGGPEDRDVERRRLGDRLLREKRLPGPVPPGDRAAAAQILEHPRAADRDLGGAGESDQPL